MRARWGLLAMGCLSLALSAAPAEARRARPNRAEAASLAEAPVANSRSILFANGCAKGERLTIAAVGDLLFHKSLQQQALTPTGSYRDFWKPLAGVLAKADLTYGNLEGSVADGVTSGLDVVKDPGKNWNNRVYSAPVLTLSYNYHPSVLDDLKAGGFDVISTANNHSLDRGAVGIDRSVRNMRARGIAYTGSRLRSAKDEPFNIVTKVKGRNIAWLACTYDTNGFRDVHDQVLHCFKHKDAVLGEIRRLAASSEIDAVILTPHWGVENVVSPERRQRVLAREAIEAGATAVLGAHPHVVGPWEKVTTADGREGLVIYSMGNFISNQRRPDQRVGELALLELVREPGAAKMRVSAAGYITTYVEISGVHRVVQAGRGVTSRPLPPGNRVYASDLPKLPRDCAAGESVTESWGGEPATEVAIMPAAMPTTYVATDADFRQPRLSMASSVRRLMPLAPIVEEAREAKASVPAETKEPAKKRTRISSRQKGRN